MEKERLYYFELSDLIDKYIDERGITKTCAYILAVLANRLYDKVKIIEPALSFLEDKEEDIYTEKDGKPVKENNESHVP